MMQYFDHIKKLTTGAFNKSDKKAGSNSGSRRNIFKKKSKPVLLIHWDGLNAVSWVMTPKAAKWQMGEKIHCRALKPVQIVQELADTLESKGTPIPSAAYLITQTILSDIIELPMASDTKVDEKRIHDMLTWEVEPLLADYYSSWSIEKTLVGLGYVTPKVATNLSEQIKQERLQARNQGGSLPLPFGNTCVDAGYLSSEQLTEAVNLQEYWQMREVSKFKLHFKKIETSPFLVEGDADSVKFLFSAIDVQIRNEWFLALQENKCQLLRIDTPINWVIDHCENDMVHFLSIDGVTTIENDSNQDVLIHRKGWEYFDSQMFVESQIIFGPSRLLPMGKIKNTESWLRERLNDVLTPVMSMDDILEFGPTVSILLQDKKTLTKSLSIPPRDPLPLIYKRPIFYKITMVVLGVMLIGALEGFFHYRFDFLDSETTSLYVDLEKKESTNELVEKANKELTEKLKKVAEQERLNAKFEKEFSTLQEIVRDRRFANIDLLDLFVRSIPNDLYLQSVVEDGWQSYEVKGWGRDEESIRQFASRLVALSETKGLRLLKSPSTRVSAGFDGLAGYEFEFRIYRKLTNNDATQNSRVSDISKQ